MPRLWLAAPAPSDVTLLPTAPAVNTASPGMYPIVAAPVAVVSAWFNWLTLALTVESPAAKLWLLAIAWVSNDPWPICASPALTLPLALTAEEVTDWVTWAERVPPLVIVASPVLPVAAVVT